MDIRTGENLDEERQKDMKKYRQISGISRQMANRETSSRTIFESSKSNKGSMTSIPNT